MQTLLGSGVKVEVWAWDMVLRDILTNNHFITAQETRPSGVCLRVALAWIWLVTAYDIWCCQWLTLDQELNPQARAIMMMGGVWGLVVCKVMGTFIVTELLRVLHKYFTAAIVSATSVLLLVLVMDW